MNFCRGAPFVLRTPQKRTAWLLRCVKSAAQAAASWTPSHVCRGQHEQPDGESGNMCSDSALLLRRAMEDRLIGRGLGPSSRCRPPRHWFRHLQSCCCPARLDHRSYLACVRHTLDRHPRLRATRIYQMMHERGYTGQRHAVARHRCASATAGNSANCSVRVFSASLGTLDLTVMSFREHNSGPMQRI